MVDGPVLAPRRDPGEIVGVNYDCPICGTQDQNLYTRCHQPLCPKGGDQSWRFPQPPQERAWINAARAWLVVVFMLIAFGFIMWGIR